MEDSVYACTSESGLFFFFFSLSCCSRHNLLSGRGANLLRVAGVRAEALSRSCAQPYVHHTASELRKSLPLDLMNSIQVSHLGCELSPWQRQTRMARRSHRGSSSIQLLPKLEAGKCILLGRLRELPTVVRRVLPPRGGGQIGNLGARRNEVGSTKMSGSCVMGAAARRAKSGQTSAPYESLKFSVP